LVQVLSLLAIAAGRCELFLAFVSWLPEMLAPIHASRWPAHASTLPCAPPHNILMFFFLRPFLQLPHLSCKQQPSKPLHKLPAAPPAALFPYILQHGRGILSLSTLQQGLQHFILPGVGYIAYTMMRNGPDIFNVLSPLALGDPICDPVNFAVMAEAFLQQHPKAIFMQVTHGVFTLMQLDGMLWLLDISSETLVSPNGTAAPGAVICCTTAFMGSQTP
jgi:hypothetical protein